MSATMTNFAGFGLQLAGVEAGDGAEVEEAAGVSVLAGVLLSGAALAAGVSGSELLPP